VVRGLAVQFALGLFVLRFSAGKDAVEALGSMVKALLGESNVGAKFVFSSPPGKGNQNLDHLIAFKVLPTVVFFSSITSILYYLGVLQVFVQMTAAFLKFLMGASSLESANAASNIFLGQSEAPLLIRKFLPTATASQIHAIMSSGFASIAGSILAIYVSIGVSEEYLIGASVMSAPAALVMSKVLCPEDADSLALGDEVEFPPPSERNVIEAAGNGAFDAIALVSSIAVMLITFLSLISLIDHMLGYLGALVDVSDLSINLVCGYLFWPIAWLLGTPVADCFVVGRLIGVKTFVNEFVGYSELLELTKGESGPQISKRAELAATYALCGFANFGSIGIQTGQFCAMCPNRKHEIVQLVISAMIAGQVACFLTACVAAILD